MSKTDSRVGQNNGINGRPYFSFQVRIILIFGHTVFSKEIPNHLALQDQNPEEIQGEVKGSTESEKGNQIDN